MPRPTRRRKPYIVVFCEGESEQAYTDFLKKEFKDVASIKRPSATGLFEEADGKFKKDKAYRDYAEVTDEIWFFFDVETKDIGLWNARMKIIKRLRTLRKKPGIKVRLLMTTGCIEYWLMLHYEMYTPPIQTVAEKQRVIERLLSKEPNYQKGDTATTARIAQNYPKAVIHSKQTVLNLLSQGLPGLEDIECFVMLVVVTESGGRKFEEKKQAYLLLSFSLLNAILVAVCNQISAFSFITPVLSILYLTVISRILSRGNFLLRISISITTMFVILTTGYILMVIFCWLYGGDQFSTAFNVFMTPGPLRCLYLVLDKITDIALYMAARKYLPKLSELKSRWLITLLFSGSLVYLITQILFRAILSEDYIQLYRASILSFLILILFFATLFLLLLNTSAREHENVQKQLLLRTNQLMEQNYQMLHEDLKENAKRLHDFHHHLKAILGLAEAAQNGEIQKYVGDLLSISYKEVHLCRCGNDVIDAILNCSAAEAKKQQIYFQYEVNFTAHIPVAPVDLCAILGNQIENALEANRQIADISARYVKIMLTQKKGFLIFRVENASAENPFSENGALKTRKEDGNLHGLGIKNIQDTVNKYNGWLKNSYDDHTFISEVLLCVSTV